MDSRHAPFAAPRSRSGHSPYQSGRRVAQSSHSASREVSRVPPRCRRTGDALRRAAQQVEPAVADTQDCSYVRGRTLIQTFPASLPPARSEWSRQHPAAGKDMRTVHLSASMGSMALGSTRGNRPNAPTGPSGASAYTLNVELPVMNHWKVVSRAARISCGARTRIVVESAVDPTRAPSASRPDV